MMASFHTDHQFTIDNNILKGKKVSYHDNYKGLGELLFSKLEENPDLVGQIDAVTGEAQTFGQMRERSVRCALWMQSQKLRPKDIVVICSGSHLDFAIPCFATLYLGAVLNCWDATAQSAVDFHHQMILIKPKMIFADKYSAAVVAEAARYHDLDVKIIVFGSLPGFLEFELVIAEPRIDQVEGFGCSAIGSLEDISLIILSSGTTGISKGVALSHRALYMQFNQSKSVGMSGKICLSFSSPSWINGTFDLLWNTLFKNTRIITPPFEEHSACALIEKYKGSWVLLSPTMINRLLKSDVLGRHDLTSVSRVIYVGSPLSTASREAFAKFIPNAEIFTAYGMTELGGYQTLQSRKSQSGSCGEIMENSQLKVIDLETGRTLAANQKGEILMKSASIMNCYYDNPQDTAKTIDDDGWLHTGDLGYFNEDGEIFMVDRLKDIIRLADYDISPFEIESVILSHPGVKEVAVVGKPHPDGDDLPIAFVVRTEDPSATSKQVTETEIVNLVASGLPDSRKQLHAGVRFIEQLPKTRTNKIRRIVLRDLAKSTETIPRDCIDP